MASPTASTPELPRLGRYQVLTKIAQGGMAEIFLAKALGAMGFERLVAIKLIHSQLSRDSEFVKMFIDEARIAMHLHHRNIVQVFDLDKAGDSYFIAMEYVHGVNLYDLYERIASKGRWIDLPLAIYIVAEVCKGLHFAHTRTGPDGRSLGIVHRDISPQNVLLSFEGEVRITDFGIAKAAERLHNTMPGIVKGKYAYMAPEILQDRPADRRVDVFAAGVLLYELLVGENPFAGATAVDTIERVLNVEVPRPSSRGALVRNELDEIVARALAKNPDERYQTAMELSEALTEHGLSLTMARRDIAAGDATVAALLVELFPEKAKALPQADPRNVNLPIVQSVENKSGPAPGGTGQTPTGDLPLPPGGANGSGGSAPGNEEDATVLSMPAVSARDWASASTLEPGEIDEETQTRPPEDKRSSIDATDKVSVVEREPNEPKTDEDLRALSDPMVVPADDANDRTLLNSEDVNRAMAALADINRQGTPSSAPTVPPAAGPAPGAGPTPVIEQRAPRGPAARPSGGPIGTDPSEAAPRALSQGPHAVVAKLEGPTAPSMPVERPIPLPGQSPVVKLLIGLVVVLALVIVGVFVSRFVREPPVLTVPMTIKSAPAGATITVDGALQAQPAPLEVQLSADRSHQITAELEGYRPAAKALHPEQGLPSELVLALEPIRGTVTVRPTPPDAKVKVGELQGTGEMRATDLEIGKDVTVRVERDGYKPFETKVRLTTSNPSALLLPALEKEDSKKKR